MKRKENKTTPSQAAYHRKAPLQPSGQQRKAPGRAPTAMKQRVQGAWGENVAQSLYSTDLCCTDDCSFISLGLLSSQCQVICFPVVLYDQLF